MFGEIISGEMLLNDGGNMVAKWWNELPDKFRSITVDASVVMPNHFHGIILIHDADVDLRVGLGTMEKGAHTGAPLRWPNAPLSQIVQWFKTMTTNEYIRGVKQFHWKAFIGKVWQRNYYEHIIHDGQDYERIFNYIVTNPSHWAEDEESRE